MDFVDEDIFEEVLLDMLTNTYDLPQEKIDMFIEFHKDVLLEVLEDTFDKYVLVTATKLK